MPSPLHLKAAKILETGKKKNIFVQAILQPMEAQGGFLFAILEIRADPSKAAEAALLLIEQLERALETFGEETHLQHRFEQMIEAINDAFARRSKEPDWSLPINDVHALIGMAVDHLIFLTGTGDLTALFLHKIGKKRFQIFNLFHGIQTTQARPSWEKPFAVILDGDLHPEDTLCVTNQPLQQQLPTEELNTILTSLPPQSSNAKIRHSFPIDIHLAMIVLKAEAPISVSAPISVAHHLPEVMERREETVHFLEDQQPNLLAFFTRIVHRLFSALRRIPWQHAWDPQQWKKWQRQTRGLVFRLKPVFKQIPQTLASFKTSRAASSWKRLPKTCRWLILAALLILLLLLTSVSWLSQAKTRRETETALLERVQEVEDLRDKASGALIYDESQARAFLGQAQERLTAFEQDYPQEQETIQRLKEDVEKVLRELRHVVTIVNPLLVADVISAGLSQKLNAFASNGTDLFFFLDDQKLYRFNPSLNRFVLVTTSGEPLGNVLTASMQGKDLFFLQEGNRLSLVNPEQGSVSTPLQGSTEETWKDVVAYEGRVYLLTHQPTGTQVIRSQGSGISYSTPRAWIQATSTDLSDAVSLAVDGTIFLLKNNGSIIRFTSGQEIGWTAGTVDPPLTSPTKIWTDAASPYLYVLEPSGKRLVVFEKESGVFLVQYQSDVFENLKSFLVDEAQKRLFFLTDTKAYRIDATHIK